ncbi:hypothetical protein E1161_13235 [Saccharopolyspora aridisoli]|uniref:Uncharacterized protein n=1 Tax=Saccharopolyspora aridisoli TaxID=2530385 RepID=A0A4R4UT58_9PSEU|nr:hypothetical protein E1161_13235 [Saccharopolyspora aridisoli]
MFDMVHPEPSWKRGDDRRVRPHLSRLYPVTAAVQPFREAWDVQAVVPGELSAWLRTTTGGWLAEVRFRVRRGDGFEGVLHTGWLPADVVEPREDAPSRPQ